ncbi:MAG: hypothetical protein AMS17_02275 [Spirochaetes bacterium DG_61]|nr:MAG: hypothetical protein AMS17_02275 [Spirochaetes bacterium DG_61]
MIKNKVFVAVITFISLGLLGLTFAFVGASLPSMRGFFQINLRQAGLISAILQLGFAITCFLGGIISDFVRKDRLLSIGTLMLGVGTLLLGRWDRFGLNCYILGVMGIGCGFLFISSNTLVVDLFPDRRGTYLNIHHFFFAIGSLIGPLIIGYLLSKELRWQTAYRYQGVSSLVIALFFLLTEVHEEKQNMPKKAREIWRMLSGKNFFPLMMLGFFAIGIQFTIMYLLVIYLEDVRGLSVSYASILLSIFFILLAIGRLLCSALVLRISQRKLIFFLLLSLSTLLWVGWLIPSQSSGAVLALTGLACSGLMPVLLSMTSMILDSRYMGTALGFLAMCGGLGGMTITFLTTVLSQRVGLRLGFGLVSAVAFLTLLYYFVIQRRYRKEE